MKLDNIENVLDEIVSIDDKKESEYLNDSKKITREVSKGKPKRNKNNPKSLLD